MSSKLQSTQEMINQIDDDFLENSNEINNKSINNNILNEEIKETQDSEIKLKENIIFNSLKSPSSQNSSNNSTITLNKNYLNINKDSNKENLPNENNIDEKNKEFENIKIEEINDIKEFKLYYHNTELYMVKIGKYSHNQIIFICYELKENIEPNFFYQNIYEVEELFNLCKIFELYKKKDKLFKLFVNLFNNNSVKLSKNVTSQSLIKLMIQVLMPDGDKSIITLELSRKEKEFNETFYDNFISFEKQLEREETKQKFLKSWEEEKLYNYEVGINFDTQVDDGSLKRSYLSKYGNKNFKNKSWKKKGIDPDDIQKEEIENEEIKEGNKKIGENKSKPEIQ